MLIRKIFLTIIFSLMLCSFAEANAQWTKLGCGEYEYTGAATNDPTKITTFIIKGNSITSANNLKIVMNVFMPQMNGQRIALEGLSGEVTIDDVKLGVSGDKNYAAHFTKDNIGIQKKIALLNISDGASIANHYSVGVDNDARIKFSDGSHTIFTTERLNERKYTDIEAENSGNGFYLTASGGIFTEISGLVDGFNIKIKPGSNIGEKLTFKTDGGQGTITIADKTFTISGDKEFTLKF